MKGSGTALRYTIPVLFLVLLAAVFIPYHPNTVRQNDSAALGKLRQSGVAQRIYATEHRDKGFACRLEGLSELGQYSGYRFSLSCPSSTDLAALSRYEVWAEPLEIGKTGFRAYCSTESGVVWYDSTGSGKSCINSRHPFVP